MGRRLRVGPWLDPDWFKAAMQLLLRRNFKTRSFAAKRASLPSPHNSTTSRSVKTQNLFEDLTNTYLTYFLKKVKRIYLSQIHSWSWRTSSSFARSGSFIISETTRSMRMLCEPFTKTISPSPSMFWSSNPARFESSY